VDTLAEFLRDHLWLVTILWLLLMAAFGGHARRRFRLGQWHPPIDAADVRFSESRVSGNSDKTLFTRFGGASNALSLTVTSRALLVEPMGPFKWLLALQLQ
jgi:hypothetical protein